MGAGCSAQTSAHDPQRSRQPYGTQSQTSSTRLISALGVMQTQSPTPTDTPPGPTSPQDLTPLVTSPNLFPTPIPSPAHTPPPHVLSPGVEIQPLPDQPLLRQRQTIPPVIELDRSTGMSRTQSDALPPKETEREPQGISKASTFPKIASNTQLETKNEKHNEEEEHEEEREHEHEREHEYENEEEEEEEEEDGDEDEDESEEDEGSTMSRANSDEPPSNKVLVVPDNNRRRNSISVLPSIDPKPKFPGSGGGEGKKTDPDLVLWISNKLKTKLKLTRISKAYDRYHLPLSLLPSFLFPYTTSPHCCVSIFTFFAGLSLLTSTLKWENKI
jgi:hypothetical protein